MNPIPLDGLTRIPATLSGHWSTAAPNVWTARASCAQPLVAVSLLVCDGRAHWSKSVRLGPDTDAVRLALGVDPGDAAHVTIGCGAIALPARLAQAGARPALADAETIETGIVWPLCRFDSVPVVDIVLLLLAASDIGFGRNQLWRLRPEHASVAEPFRTILAGGRSGEAAWPSPSAADCGRR